MPPASIKQKSSDGSWNYPRPRLPYPPAVEPPRPEGSPAYYDDGILLDDQYGPSDFHNIRVEPPQSPREDIDHHHSSTEPPPPTVVVRGEEIGIVIVVLLLWVGAIALFFNRWGKIRMLEPYQPKFCESHRPSCAIADVPPITHFPRTMSKFNISSETSPHFAKCTYNYYPPAGGGSGGYGGGPSGGSVTTTTVTYPSTSTGGPTVSPYRRPSNFSSSMSTAAVIQRNRQNSVFSPAMPLNGYVKNSSRKTKSAIDLSNLILAEEFVETSRRNSKNSITHL